MTEINDICNCDEFKEALQQRTDNEADMPAIMPHENDNTKYEIGIIDAPIKFCPWCGKEVKCPSPS